MFIIHNIFTKHILIHIFTLFKDCSILHSLPIFQSSQPNCSQAEAMAMKMNQTEWEELFFSFRRHQCCVADSCVFLREIRIQHTAALFMTVVNNSWARPSINMCQRRLICSTLQTKMENIVVTMTNVFLHYPPGWHSTIKAISVRVLQEEWLLTESLWINTAIWESRSRSSKTAREFTHQTTDCEVRWSKGAKQN